MGLFFPAPDTLRRTFDENADFAAKLGVNAVPTFILLAASGDEAQRASGFLPVGEFLPWLTNRVSPATPAAIQSALCKRKLAEIDQLRTSTNVQAPDLIATELFDLCATRNPALLQSLNEPNEPRLFI